MYESSAQKTTAVGTHARLIALLVLSAAAAGLAWAAGRSQIVVKDMSEFPESITSTKNGTVFFGSITKSMVYKAAPGSASAVPWIKAGTAGLKNVLGVFADEPAKTLWVCSSVLPFASAPGAKGETALKSFDLSSGAFKASYTFPGGTGVCNDIAVAKDGTVYVTETNNGQVLRLKRGGKALELWASDPALASADGIALLQDGSVYVNGVRTGVLARIPVRFDGSPGPVMKLETSRPLVSPDGMRSVGPNTILLAEGEGRVDEVTVNGEKAEIRVLKGDFKDQPTAVTLVGDTAFVLQAKLKYLNDPKLKGQDPGPFSATAVPYHPSKQ